MGEGIRAKRPPESTPGCADADKFATLAVLHAMNATVSSFVWLGLGLLESLSK